MKRKDRKLGTTKNSLRGRVCFWFDDLETPMGKSVDITVIILIFAALFLYALQTYNFEKNTLEMLQTAELVIGVIFLVEYLLRLWSSENRIRYFTSIYSVIDLIAVLPVFITFGNLQFLRIFRVFRVFRLLRFLERKEFFFGTVTETSLIGLRIVFTVASIVYLSSAFIYLVEKDGNPGITNFTDAVYYSTVTLSTVGFGDITPKTQSGRLITIGMITAGLIFVPLQIGRLFHEMIVSSGKNRIVCKKCGLTYHEKDAIHCRHCGETIYQETDGE
ncbi:MAG: ion transporter [Candidatus Altiarchaeota archaeon]|nr:ion transporter [Candidatus Altiarchaeota archaeon]